MGVRKNEKLLLEASRQYALTGLAEPVLKSAIVYAQSKRTAANRREKWKRRKRLGEKNE